jgi:hypothetical protein
MTFFGAVQGFIHSPTKSNHAIAVGTDGAAIGTVAEYDFIGSYYLH